MFSWFKWRFKEKSSWHALIIGGAAVLVILGMFPLTTIIAWGALAWAVYNFWKAE